MHLVRSMGVMKKEDNPISISTTRPMAQALDAPENCPPDVDQLGRSTWNLLHTITANYSKKPSLVRQIETKKFIGLFSKMYPY